VVKLSVLAVCMAMAGGCDRTPRPPRVDDPENQRVLAKLQPYINCLGDHSPRVFEAADLYRERLTDEQGLGDDVSPVVRASLDPVSCIEVMAASREREPALPDLDTAGKSFADALQTVHAVTSEAESYFDRKSTKFDRAKGVAMHPKIVAAFADFERAQGVLFDLVQQRNRQIYQDQLARREQKEGRTLVVRGGTLVLQAETVVALAATSWDRIDTIDLDALGKHLAELEELAHEMSVHAVATPKEMSAFDGYHGFEDRVRLFLVAVRQLVMRRERGVAWTEAERLMIAANNEAGVPGTPASVVSAYNRLVELWGGR
jgi:hypothetical protein